MKLIITLLFTLLLWRANAQTADTVLNKRLAEYMQMSKDLNIDKLLTYMYPRIFELAPKKDIAAALKSAFTDDDLKITLDSMNITGVKPVQKFAKGSYTLFDYFSSITFQLTKEDDKKDAEPMVEAFKSQFGADNVSFDKALNAIKVKQYKKALAIKDNYTAGKWTFLGVEKSKMLKKIIPAAIIAKYQL